MNIDTLEHEFENVIIRFSAFQHLVHVVDRKKNI